MFRKDEQIEQEHCHVVQSFIDTESKRLSKLIEQNLAKVKAQGSKFNEDNPNGGMYSGMELTELHYEMQNEMQNAEEAKNDIYFYKKLIKEPYFARVDFTPDRTGRKQEVYIGLKTLQNPDTYETYVCDWRAPISSLFYEDFEDKAYFTAPVGMVEGDLSLKRQFKFENGELKYFVDSDLKIDDDILRDVLSSQTGDRLKVIVNSIQREQNRAIRYSESENICVIGAAGSGKTSVGFHRLAYLLYRNRKELTSAETLMFSNNDIFSSYVADIIPELGEMPINYASFYSIFKAEMPAYGAGDYYELADELIKGNQDRKYCVDIKYGDDFETFLKDAAEHFIPTFSDVRFLDETVLTKEDILNRYLSDSEISPFLRGGRLTDFVHGRIDDYFTVHKDEIFAEIDEETDVGEDTNRVITMKRRILKQETAAMIAHALDCDPVGFYCKLLKEYGEKKGLPSFFHTQTTDALKWGELLFEDSLCIVRLKQFLGTAAIIPTVKHILIDEAQDLCLLQHKIIRDMFPKANFTLLADGNQAILPDVNLSDTEKLASFYRAHILELEKSYRSTAQINQFALSLLPSEKRYQIFEREGEPVTVINQGDSVENIAALAKEFCEKGGNLAILTKTAEEAKELFAVLRRKIPNLQLCNSKSAELADGPCVMNLALTKGLEFDSVIVYGKNGSFDGEENKTFLYMAVTRALHRLGIVE